MQLRPLRNVLSETVGKTLILGLGNELLSDDAVGIKVVRELRRRLPHKDDLDVHETSAAGLAILDLVCGYQNLIVVDAIRTNGGEPGQVYRFCEDSFSRETHLWSAHGIGLFTKLFRF